MTIIKFFIIFIINSSLVAYKGGNTDFSGLPKDLGDIYGQLMILAVRPNNHICTSVAVAETQIITAYHCVQSIKTKKDITYNTYKDMYIVPNDTILSEKDQLFFFHYKLVLNQDFSIHTDVDKDLDPTLLPVFMTQEDPADVALVTINNTNIYNKLPKTFDRDKIIMTKKEYCNYFEKGCTMLKHGYSLYFFGLRDAESRRFLFSKNLQINSFIPEWKKVILDEDIDVYNDMAPSITLNVIPLYSESGDSGGPVFICKYNIIMRDENECKMIAVLSSSRYVESTFIPIFLLKSLDERNIKQNLSIVLSIKHCNDLITNYNNYKYVYFNQQTNYFRFSMATDKNAENSLITIIDSVTKNTGFHFTKCEDDKLYFDKKGNRNRVFQLSDYKFYKDYSKLLTTNKFDNCKDFDEYFMHNTSFTLYTFQSLTNDDSLFRQQFLHINKTDRKLYVYNRTTNNFEEMKYDFHYEECIEGSNKIPFLLFKGLDFKLYLELKQILFY